MMISPFFDGGRPTWRPYRECRLKAVFPCTPSSPRVYYRDNMIAPGRGGLSMTKTQHGIVACVIGATTWGFNGVVSQFLLSHYPVEPSWLASIRMCLAGLFLTLMVLPTKRAEIRQMLHDPVSLRHLVLFALFGLILSQFSYLSAIKNSNAGTATVLQTLSVVLMSLYLAVRFHKRPTGREILSVFLAFGGVYLAATNGNPSTMVISPLGLTWGLIGAIACVTYPVLSQGLAAHWGAAVANGLGMIIGGVFLSLTLQVWTVWPALDLTGWLAVAFIVIIGTALSFTAFVTGISEIGPMKATLLGTLEPVVASVTSAIALGTTFHTVELIGYACIIATVFIIILQKKPAIS